MGSALLQILCDHMTDTLSMLRTKPGPREERGVLAAVMVNFHDTDKMGFTFPNFYNHNIPPWVDVEWRG